MSESKKSIEEILEQITCARLLKDNEYLGSDENNRAKLHSKTKIEISDKINQLSSELRESIVDDTNLSMTIEMAVATQMLEQVEKNSQIPVSLIVLNLDAVYETLKIPNPNINIDRNTNNVEANSMLNDGETILKQIPEEIKKGVEEAFIVASQNAHKESATKEEQSMMVGLMYATSLDSYIESGIPFKDLQNTDKAEVIKIIKDLQKNGNEKQAAYYLQTLGITSEDINNPEYSHFDHEMDTLNAEQDEVAKKINDIAGKISSVLKYGKTMGQDIKTAQIEEIQKQLEKSEYSVDAIFKGLLDTDGFNIDEELFEEFVKKGIERVKDPNVAKEFDGWLSYYMMSVACSAKEMGKMDCAKELLETINVALGDNAKNIKIEDINRDVLFKVQTYLQKNNGDSTIDIANIVIESRTQEKINNIESGYEPEYAERNVTTETTDKKANLIKLLNGLGKAKGLTRVQSQVEHLLRTSADKEIVIEAVLEYLEMQKDSNQQESKNGRSNLFKSIVNFGIDNPETIDLKAISGALIKEFNSNGDTKVLEIIESLNGISKDEKPEVPKEIPNNDNKPKAPNMDDEDPFTR